MTRERFHEQLERLERETLDLGHVVGSAWEADGDTLAFLYTGGPLTYLGGFGGGDGQFQGVAGVGADPRDYRHREGAEVYAVDAIAHLIQRFDRFQEYIFLLAIGWCLGLAELAALMKLSPEIGAFVAGAEDAVEWILQKARTYIFSTAEPALVSVDGSMMALAWAQFETQPPVALYPGMSLEVEVIAAEAKDAMLVPLQALRQNPDGTYFVEVLQPDNTFAATSVSVGLKDLANAQILSGLIEGDQVSTESK